MRYINSIYPTYHIHHMYMYIYPLSQERNLYYFETMIITATWLTMQTTIRLCNLGTLFWTTVLKPMIRMQVSCSMIEYSLGNCLAQTRRPFHWRRLSYIMVWMNSYNPYNGSELDYSSKTTIAWHGWKMNPKKLMGCNYYGLHCFPVNKSNTNSCIKYYIRNTLSLFSHSYKYFSSGYILRNTI